MGRIRKKKAPGPDKISPEVAKIVAECHGEIVLAAFNGCIMKAKFPKARKGAALVLIEKPVKEGVPAGY